MQAEKPKFELVKESAHGCEHRSFAYRAIEALAGAPQCMELKITLAGLEGKRVAHAAHVYAERRGFRVSCQVAGGVLYIAKRVPRFCVEHSDRPAAHLVDRDPLCCGCYLKRLESRKWTVLHRIPESDRKAAGDRRALAPALGERPLADSYRRFRGNMPAVAGEE